MGNLIYFGISPTTVGLNENEPGYSNLEAFHELTKNTDVPRLLTLRMTNNNINQIVLSDQKLQNKIMNQVIAVAQEYDFDGILLDLEYSGLPTNTVKNQILVFTEIAATKAHAQGLTLAMAVFGDTFYRARPYDLKELSQYVDHFYIMAYDLHKVLGDPGPNFPLAGARQFGYDLETMVADISKVLDSDNMTVVFGLFGYDWWVDEEKRPIKAAKALTLAQIKEKFVGECVLQDCVVKRDEQAREVEVNYVDEFSGFHVVWFEDEQSMSEKIQFLQNAGINSVAVWGWGYY